MKLGDVVESAIWATGEESPDMRARYELDVRSAIGYLCYSKGFVPGPVTFVEKRPEEDKVPDVPEHVSGQRVRLLVGEAIVVEKRVVSPSGSFVANLEYQDLVRLRTIIRREALVNGLAMSDSECDSIIEQIGPEAAVETLRQLH